MGRGPTDGVTPAARRAEELVAAVRDDPAQRLRLAAGFYHQRAGGRTLRAYRRAEVAFMRWPIWPYEHRWVWRTDRSRVGIALVRAVVGRWSAG